jgi:hypothetical protein
MTVHLEAREIVDEYRTDITACRCADNEVLWCLWGNSYEQSAIELLVVGHEMANRVHTPRQVWRSCAVSPL